MRLRQFFKGLKEKSATADFFRYRDYPLLHPVIFLSRQGFKAGRQLLKAINNYPAAVLLNKKGSSALAPDNKRKTGSQVESCLVGIVEF